MANSDGGGSGSIAGDVLAAKDVGGDARTCAVRYDDKGERFCELGDSTLRMSEEQ